MEGNDKGFLEEAHDNVIENRGKVTPDHIIMMDYLVYVRGDQIHELCWEDIKRELKRLAHEEAGI